MLRIALLANGLLLIVSAIICFFAASGFEFLHWDGLVSFAIGLTIALLVASVIPIYLAFRPHKAGIQIVIALNVVCAMAAAGVILFAGLEPAGNVLFVTLTGIVLLALAIFEYLGLRQRSVVTP